MHRCSEHGLSDSVLPNSNLSYISSIEDHGMTRICIWYLWDGPAGLGQGGGGGGGLAK